MVFIAVVSPFSLFWLVRDKIQSSKTGFKCGRFFSATEILTCLSWVSLVFGIPFYFVICGQPFLLQANVKLRLYMHC